MIESLRARLRTWQLRLGLSRRTNPNAYRGPSPEDLAREASWTATASTSPDTATDVQGTAS